MLDFAAHLFCSPCGVCQEVRETNKELAGNVMSAAEAAMKKANEETPLNNA